MLEVLVGVVGHEDAHRVEAEVDYDDHVVGGLQPSWEEGFTLNSDLRGSSTYR